MSFLVAAWEEMRKPRPAPPSFPPLCISVDLVALNLARVNSDEGIARIGEDLTRLGRGLPTRAQLKRKLAADKAEAAQAKRLAGFAR